MFDTESDAKQKLVGTVVFLEDDPVYIETAIGNGTKLKLYWSAFVKPGNAQPPGSDLPYQNILYDGWNFKDLGSKLGYTNYIGPSGKYKEAIYVERMPVRKSHATQGLSGHNLRVSSLKGSEILGLPPSNVTWDSTCKFKKWMFDTFKGNYPSLKEVQNQFIKDSGMTSVAFNRSLAIRVRRAAPFALEYKNRSIGYTEDFQSWTIDKDFDYLEEYLVDMAGLSKLRFK